MRMIFQEEEFTSANYVEEKVKDQGHLWQNILESKIGF